MVVTGFFAQCLLPLSVAKLEVQHAILAVSCTYIRAYRHMLKTDAYRVLYGGLACMEHLWLIAERVGTTDINVYGIMSIIY